MQPSISAQLPYLHAVRVFTHVFAHVFAYVFAYVFVQDAPGILQRAAIRPRAQA